MPGVPPAQGLSLKPLLQPAEVEPLRRVLGAAEDQTAAHVLRAYLRDGVTADAEAEVSPVKYEPF